MQFLAEPFSALRSVKQFIVYKICQSKDRPGKIDKIPTDGDNKINPHDPANWLDVDSAILKSNLFGNEYGVGFVLTENDPYWFLDIDDCWDEAVNNWSPLALNLLQMFNGAAVEVSLSNRGLHILGSGKTPAHGCTNKNLKLEFYNTKRFVALTGTNAIGSIAQDFTAILPQLIATYFSNHTPHNKNEWTDCPRPEWNGPVDDEQLITRMLKSNSARVLFGSRASVKDLWGANYDVLGPCYNHDDSAYDAALACHLAYWTGNDCERMLRLMKKSKLARGKWEREDYLTRTILAACNKQKECLQDKRIQTEAAAGIVNTNAGFVTFEEQLEMFKGCVYIRDTHRVLIPGGEQLKPEQFRATFGGHSFPMDATNSRVTRNAWEVFTESQIVKFPQASSACFKPLLPSGVIIEDDGRTAVNTYWPIYTLRKIGDASLFLNHLKKLLPNQRDQTILLSYLAACVQYKGVKFQWAPFIQGVEGNGKTVFTWCTAYAIGQRYVSYPKADQIGKNFNKWMHEKLLIGIEDIHTHDSQHEIIEALKPMITNSRLAIEPKGVDSMTVEICCNFIINSNYQDGLPKSRNDRRFAPLFTAQQSKEDLIRDGLTSEYFSKLFKWLSDEDGYAIVSEFLHTYDIPPDEFNPANKQIAPITTSTDLAIEASLGNVEQEIIEAIEQETPGFRKGWISSFALDRLLERLNVHRRWSRQRRRKLLHDLGYDPHPHLTGGRVNNIIANEGGKPRLYICKNHPNAVLADQAEIAKTYCDAQA